MSLGQQKFWPNPTSSRGQELTSLRVNYMTKIRCWEALLDGPAFTIFLKIKPSINEYLENHPDLANGPRARYTCCMVGHQEDKIRPAVIIHGPEPAYMKRADSLVRNSHEWRDFKGDNPLFLLMTAARAPSRIGPEEYGSESVLIQTPELFPSLFGTAVSFHSEQLQPVVPYHVATLGGVVLLDGKLCGLTVAHAMGQSRRHNQHLSEQVLDASSIELYTFGDSDEDFDFVFNSHIAESRTNSDDAALASSSRASLTSLTSGKDSPTTEADVFRRARGIPAGPPTSAKLRTDMKQIGKVLFSATADGDTEQDWAICSLEPSIITKLEQSRTFNSIPVSPPQHNQITVKSIADRSLVSKSALVVTASRGVVRGVMRATPSFYRAEGGNRFVEVLAIHLEQQLGLGDCGSWVVSAEDGQWLGHIVAEQPHEACAYLIPALTIQRGIEQATQSSLTLPQPLQKAASGIGNSPERTALSWTPEQSQGGLVQLLLASQDVDINLKGSFGHTLLSWAAKQGYQGVVKLLLVHQDVDVNSKGPFGRTPLSWAAENGHYEVVKLLLACQDMDVNSKDSYGRTPLSRAAAEGHQEVVELLLTRQDIDINLKGPTGLTPISWAAEKGYQEVVQLLLARQGVDVNSKDSYGRTLLSWAVEKGHSEVVQLLLAHHDVDVNVKDLEGRPLLSWAAEKGHQRVVQLLLAHQDVDVNSNNSGRDTPLSRAAQNGHLEMVQLLLARQDVDVNSKDREGRTPLSWAAQNRHPEVVQLLLARQDVDVNSKDREGRTPLSWAAQNGHPEVVQLLLARQDVDLNTKDSEGRPPLSRAAENGHIKVVKLLLTRQEVLVDTKDSEGHTPLSRAAENGHTRVAKLLQTRQEVVIETKDSEGRTPTVSGSLERTYWNSEATSDTSGGGY